MDYHVKLKSLQKEMHMSIEEMAKEIGVSKSSLHLWLTKPMRLSFKNQRILLAYFKKRIHNKVIK